MLRSRCISAGLRAVYPAATFGMYTPEERDIIAEQDEIRKPVTIDLGATPQPETTDDSAERHLAAAAIMELKDIPIFKELMAHNFKGIKPGMLPQQPLETLLNTLECLKANAPDFQLPNEDITDAEYTDVEPMSDEQRKMLFAILKTSEAVRAKAAEINIVVESTKEFTKLQASYLIEYLNTENGGTE